jgi:hypothetical protein
MKNPWGNIPTTAPFVLADDAPYVEAFDAICDLTDGNDHKLDTNFPVGAENVIHCSSPGILKL